jgi:hypothetical protein
MAKLHLVTSNAETGTHGKQAIYLFQCPGCGNAHPFYVPRWTWNGSMDRPTFTPSLVCNPQDEPGKGHRCHSFVTDGRIQFLEDCYHALKGQTVEIPEWED